MDLSQFWFQSAGGGGFPIGNSLRFRQGSRLTRSFTGTARTTLTVSGWVKLGKNHNYGANLVFYGTGGGGNTQAYLGFGEKNGFTVPQLDFTGGSYENATHLDFGAWLHVVYSRNGTSSHTLYINGVQSSMHDGGTGNNPNSWLTGPAEVNNPNGYVAELHVVDGQALDPTTFGEFNNDGVWVPKEVTDLTYGTNGFYLDFSDPDNIGADRSGNGNDFTPTGFELTDTTSTLYDWVADSPTDNFSTLNPLNTTGGDSGIQSGNLENTDTNSSVASTYTGDISMSEGLYYFEVTRVTADNGCNLGIIPDNFPITGGNSGVNDNVQINQGGTLIVFGTSTGGYLPSISQGDILCVAFNADNGNVWFGRNGTFVGDPVAGTSPAATVSMGTGWVTYVRTIGGGGNELVALNHGNRPFAHTPPAGFEPLSTAELPAVDITNPSEHFQTLLSDDAKTPEPAAIGEAYGGGFYAGRIKDGNKVYNLIVSPKASGQASTIRYKVSQTANPTPALAKNDVNGLIAQNDALTNGTPADYPAFLFADGLSIGGFSDWYVPSRYELEILYRNFKPTTQSNAVYGTNGANPYSVPPASANTSGDPAQTSVAAFQAGGAEAFPTDNNHWAATEAAADTRVWRSAFANGDHDGDNLKDTAMYVRTIRREFAYDAGLLDLAQATFPNGLWWIKDRQNSNNHQLVDSVRGGNLAMSSNLNNAESSYSAPSGSSVAWCWNLLDNRSNGFDIVQYQGTNSVQSINHQLGLPPEFMIFKSHDTTGGWGVYHASLGPTKYLVLNEVGEAGTNTTVWNDTAPTDTAFTVGSSSLCNQNNANYTGYLWYSVPGYSSFGSFTPNGSTDGPFCFTGHRPRWILLKGTVGNTAWGIFDTARDTYNPVVHGLYPADPVGETVLGNFDLLSNGFKVRTTAWNDPSFGKIIWASFAEHPFGGSNVSPSPAR